MQSPSTAPEVRRAPDHPQLRAAAVAVWSGASRLARRRVLAPVAVALAALVLRAVLLLWVPAPKPAIPDEFSNLLLADTFASGRLANPQHPMWVHFETLHVISHPSYASKYPPLQGAFLAAGQVLTGQPWFGVLLSVGLMCGALCWAIQGWLPPVWGLLGGVFAVLQIGVLSYWSESYWGGAAAAVGGALVVGALPRLVKNPRWPLAGVYGLGCAMLANSRPYEGAVLGAVCGAVLIAGLWKRLRDGLSGAGALLVQVILPAVVAVAPVLLWMAWYNRHLTHDAFTMPYVLHERQYAIWSAFVWVPPSPAPAYTHEILRALWMDWDGSCKKFERSHILRVRGEDLLRLGMFFLGLPLFAWVLFSVPGLVRCRRTRVPLLLLGSYYAGMLVLTRVLPHYFAPATALVFIAAAGAVRLAWRSRPTREFASFCLIAVALLAVVRMAQPASRFLFDKHRFAEARDRVSRQLSGQPGPHLVIVRYGADHDVNDEWVFNRADIDRSDVVWAHYMGPEKDEELLHYYPRRRVWLLDEDNRVTLRPYSEVFPAAFAQGRL